MLQRKLNFVNFLLIIRTLKHIFNHNLYYTTHITLEHELLGCNKLYFYLFLLSVFFHNHHGRL